MRVEPPPDGPRPSARSGRIADTDHRSEDPEEVPRSGRCEAISRRRFHPVEIQEFPLRQQVVPDPVDAKMSAALITDAASVDRILPKIGGPLRTPPITPGRGPPPWRMLPSRCRTGTSSAGPSLTSSSISASSGSRSLAPERDAAAPLVSRRIAAPNTLAPATKERGRLHRARPPSAPPLHVDGASRLHYRMFSGPPAHGGLDLLPQPERSNSRRSPGSTGGDG